MKTFFKMFSFENDSIKIQETNCKQSQITQIFNYRNKLSKNILPSVSYLSLKCGPMWAARKWSDMSISSSLSLFPHTQFVFVGQFLLFQDLCCSFPKTREHKNIIPTYGDENEMMLRSGRNTIYVLFVLKIVGNSEKFKGKR